MASSRLSLQISTSSLKSIDTQQPLTKVQRNINEFIQIRRKTILMEPNLNTSTNDSFSFTKNPSSFLNRNDSANRRMSMRDERLLKILSAQADEPLYVEENSDPNRGDCIDNKQINAGTCNTDNSHDDHLNTQMQQLLSSAAVAEAAAATTNDENTPPSRISVCDNNEGCDYLHS